LALAGTASGIFNLTDGRPHSIAELATLALGTAGMNEDFRRLPRQKERRDYHLTIDKARRELGFEPQVDLAKGMRQEFGWLRSLSERRDE
jgi:nucleoside-diphosphate-sugar epimerase